MTYRLKYKRWYCKSYRGKHRQTFFDLSYTSVILVQSTKAKDKKIKASINRWDLIKHVLLHSKGNHKQNEKTTYRLGKNICKWCDQQGLNFQNKQAGHESQCQKKNTAQLKNGQNTWINISPKRHIEGHQLGGKIFHIANW